MEDPSSNENIEKLKHFIDTAEIENTHMGRLWKMGGIIPYWQERYFVVENGTWSWWGNKNDFDAKQKPHHRLTITNFQIDLHPLETQFSIEGPDEKDIRKRKVHMYRTVHKDVRDRWISALVTNGGSPPTYLFSKPEMDFANRRYRAKFKETDFLYTEIDTYFLMPNVDKNKKQTSISCKIYISNNLISIVLSDGQPYQIEFKNIKRYQAFYKHPSVLTGCYESIRDAENFLSNNFTQLPKVLQIEENNGAIYTLHSFFSSDDIRSVYTLITNLVSSTKSGIKTNPSNKILPSTTLQPSQPPSQPTCPPQSSQPSLLAAAYPVQRTLQGPEKNVKVQNKTTLRPLCVYFSNGNCANGSDCANRHESKNKTPECPICSVPLPKLTQQQIESHIDHCLTENSKLETDERLVGFGNSISTSTSTSTFTTSFTNFTNNRNIPHNSPPDYEIVEDDFVLIGSIKQIETTPAIPVDMIEEDIDTRGTVNHSTMNLICAKAQVQVIPSSNPTLYILKGEKENVLKIKNYIHNRIIDELLHSKSNPSSKNSSSSSTSTTNSSLPISSPPPSHISISWPMEWSRDFVLSPQQVYSIVPVRSGTNEYHNISSRLKQTLPKASIVSINRVQNKLLWERYLFEHKTIARNNNGFVNELYLWHGTSKTDPNLICKEGLDMRYCDSGMWGRGTYLAEKASFSDEGYKHVIPGSSVRRLILARVLVGYSFDSVPSNSLRVPPIRLNMDIPVRYDSVCGIHTSFGSSKVYVVYENNKAFPSYSVDYRL